MPLRRTLEISAWAGGLLLLAIYFGIRAWSAQASEEGVEAMRQARAAHAAMLAANPDAGIPPTASAAPKSLSAAQPDTSTWNQKRIEEYHESLKHSATPQAVLRIPKLKLEVPVYTGTSDFVLNRGAGHIEGTAAVDSTTGNIGVAAHRDGFFRVLKDIEVGDANFSHLVSYGANNMIIAWESGNGMSAQVRSAADGGEVSSTFSIDVTDHRYQAFKSFPDGSVAYAGQGSSSQSIRVARVMPCEG